MNIKEHYSDIQGLVIRGYTLNFVEYWYVQVSNAQQAREWLGAISEAITTAVPWDKNNKPKTHLNIAFTYRGLQALGIEQKSLDSFAPEFIQGMEKRAHLLGDVGTSDPARWDVVGLHSAGAHILLLVYGVDQLTLDDYGKQLQASFKGVTLLGKQIGSRPPSMKEHFGFVDGISQPAIQDTKDLPDGEFSHIPAGEFLFGHDNAYQLPSPAPIPPQLGFNGTYLVYRKLYQDVFAFRQFVASQTETPDEADWLAAKMVGRWYSGAPLALSPDEDDPALGADRKRNNAFKYSDDRSGYACPFGAHIRRANPRDVLDELGERESYITVNKHRIMRRGIPYGPTLPLDATQPDGVERGLVFIALNAIITRQFEFVQQTWLNNAKFHGLYDDQDPLLGDNDDNFGHMTIPRIPVRRHVDGFPSFVQTRGGDYCFIPSMTALRFIASGQA